jgi:hypothetical protein
MTTTLTQGTTYKVKLRRPHDQQQAFIDSVAKRIIVRAGRRGGKTVGIAIRAVKAFLEGQRVLYAAPTQDQVDAFWHEVKRSLIEPITAGVYYKNESLHIIEVPMTKQRIRAKTAWNADTLRGDYADLLILDEYQLMDEQVWNSVGAPMLFDNDGTAVFIYTPPSLRSRSVSKARDPLHAAKMFKHHVQSEQENPTGRLAAFHFSSFDNPYISQQALSNMSLDMSSLAIRQEIMAEDVDEIPGALWTRENLDTYRVDRLPDDLARVVIGVDPPGGATECGIVVAAKAKDGQYYVLADHSLQASPERWATTVIDCYTEYDADAIVSETNFGGDMVQHTLQVVGKQMNVLPNIRPVRASRGKAVRAEPIAALYERGLVHHHNPFPLLEDELCSWTQGDPKSPNRLDALVWALTDLSTVGRPNVRFI